VQTWHSSVSALRREEVMLTRLQIGHTRLTHGYFLRGELAPFGNNCSHPMTVTHSSRLSTLQRSPPFIPSSRGAVRDAWALPP
jgi:hypothetical protein